MNLNTITARVYGFMSFTRAVFSAVLWNCSYKYDINYITYYQKHIRYSDIMSMDRGDDMKTAIITGASSGMGREFVYAVDRYFSPDEIWVIARREHRLAELSEKCSARVRPLAMDLSDSVSFENIDSLLRQEQPQICALVNAAGYGVFGEFEKLSLEEQLGIVDLNARSLTAMCRICLPNMAPGGSIINLGSNSSWQPVPYMNVYAASKAYVLSFSRGLGRELKSRNIHVMCVCPGWIRTEFFDRAVKDDTITYFDRYYTAEQVVDKAMKDLRKKKTISILGLPVRLQVAAVKHLPVSMVMNTWCRQQKKP